MKVLKTSPEPTFKKYEKINDVDIFFHVGNFFFASHYIF